MAKVESFHCVSFYCWMLCSSFVFSLDCCVIEKVALRDAWFYGVSSANAFCRGPRSWLIFLRWLKHTPLFFWDQQVWPGHRGFCLNLPLLFSTLSLLLAAVAMDVFISFIVSIIIIMSWVFSGYAICHLAEKSGPCVPISQVRKRGSKWYEVPCSAGEWRSWNSNSGVRTSKIRALQIQALCNVCCSVC